MKLSTEFLGKLGFMIGYTGVRTNYKTVSEEELNKIYEDGEKKWEELKAKEEVKEA